MAGAGAFAGPDGACGGAAGASLRGVHAARWLGADAVGGIESAGAADLDPARETDSYVRRNAAEALFKIYWRLGDRTRFLLP